MPNFKANVLRKLLKLATAKANIPFENIPRASFEILSAEINEEVNNKDLPPVSEKYLYERYLEILKADDNTDVSASLKYIDKICVYVGAKNYYDFVSRYFPNESIEVERLPIILRNKKLFVVVLLLMVGIFGMIYTLPFVVVKKAKSPNIDSLVHVVVQDRINQLELQATRKYSFLLDSNSISTYSEIEGLVKGWGTIKARQRNTALLLNGKYSVTGNKRIQNILGYELIYAPLNFMQAHQNQLVPYLLKKEISYRSPRTFIYTYGLVDKSKCDYRITSKGYKYGDTYEVEVHYNDPVRCVVVEHVYPNNDKKTRHYIVYSLPQFESFRFHKVYGHWELVEQIPHGKQASLLGK